MSKRFITGLLGTLLALTVVAVVHGQSTGGRISPVEEGANESDLFALLPASDFIVDINVRLALTQAMPRLLAKSPAKLEQIHAGLEQLKTATGIDARVVDRIVIGATYPNQPGAIYASPQSLMTNEGLIIIRGRFDAGTLLSLGKFASGNNLVKQEHAGKSYYTFKVNEGLFGASTTMRQMGEAALAILDNRTIAVGTPATVRYCLEAGQSGGEANAELARFIAAHPGAVINVAMNLKPSAKVASTRPSGKASRQGLDNIDLVGARPDQAFSTRQSGPDELTRVMESIERMYFSVRLSPSDNLQAVVVARTQTVAQAQELKGLLDGFKEMFSSAGVTQPKVENPFSDLRASVDGNEVKVQVEIKPTDAGSLFADGQRSGGKTTAPPIGKTRPGRTRRRS